MIIYGNSDQSEQQPVRFEFLTDRINARITEQMPFAGGHKGSVVAPLLLTASSAGADHLPAFPPVPPTPPPIMFNVRDFEKTMTLTALVTIDGVKQDAGTLLAFAGTEIRGLQERPSTPPFGRYVGLALYQIVLYAHGEGDTMTFKYLGKAGQTQLTGSLVFTVDSTVGSLIDPVSLTSGTAAPPPPSRTTTFNPSIYEKSMVVSALVMVGGVRQTEGALVALVGQQMRGT